MALHNKVFKVALAVVAGLVIGAGVQEESQAGGYEDLCHVFPSGCEYAPSTAPVIATDVCFTPATSSIVVKNSSSCPGNSYPFYVKHGEVLNPTTGVVLPYIALPDACDMGYCAAFNPNDPDGEAGALCCTAGGCVEIVPGDPCGGEILYCENGEEGEGQPGNWSCKESE